MAISYTSIEQLSNLLIPGYDKAVEFELRETPTFRSIVDRRPVSVDNPGDTVYFTWYADLGTTETPLSETVTPDPIQVANPTRTPVVVKEYGTWLPKTLKLQKLAFTSIDMEIAELLARQQSDTIDNLVRKVLDTGTNTLGDGTAVLSAATVRRVRNKMRSANVAFKDGQNYVAHVHPDVTYDLMAEQGQNVWASPHTYVDTAALYSGEVGKFSAVRFVENTRCTVTGSGATAVYNSYVVGPQALVEANNIEPHTVLGNITDPLKRFIPVGWHGMLGWNLFRPEALLIVKNKSSLAA